MSRRVAFALASLVLASCKFSPSGGAVNGDDDDADIDSSTIDGRIDAPTDGAIDAPTDSSIDAPIDACGDVCDVASGTISSCGQVVTTCPSGCTSMDSPSGTGVHCKQMTASNGVTVGDVEGADVDITLLPASIYTFNTDTGEIQQFGNPVNGPGVTIRAAGTGVDAVSHIRFRTTAAAGTTPGLGIFGFARLTVPATTIVRPIAPTMGHAAVLVARGPISVAGDLDVGAGRAQTALGGPATVNPGPGGGRGAIDGAPNNAPGGCAAGGNGFGGTGSETGGGGGGLGTAGGKGGPQSQASDMGGTAVTFAMLDAACPQVNLTPLRGGSGGGSGGGGGADGGGGGGAVQLTSFVSVSLTNARLFAGGAGGEGGTGGNGAGGAGAGGGILLEAPMVSISGGSVTAGGGGGGGGNGGARGENAHADGMVAMGNGNGGDGATGSSAASGEVIAENGMGNIDGTGGGGGGAGIIHVRSIATPSMTGSPVIHPQAGTSTAVSQ